MKCFRNEDYDEVDQIPRNHSSHLLNNAINRYGLPTGDFVVRYSNHILQYDTTRKIPKWVLEHMTKDTLRGSAERNNCNFKTDNNNIPKQFQSQNNDYLGSGYARGHMVPASMCTFNSLYMKRIIQKKKTNIVNFEKKSFL